MPRPGSTPPADAMVVGYSNPESPPVPLRSSAYAGQFPPPPGATVTTYLDSEFCLRQTDQPFGALVEESVKRHKADNDHAPGWVAPRDPRLGPGDPNGLKGAARKYNGYLFGGPDQPANEVELAAAEMQRRVDEVRRERPGLTISEAMAEITRYGAAMPDVEDEPPPAAAPTPAPVALRPDQYAADLQWLVDRYGPAHPPRQRYASTGAKGPQGSMGLFQDEGREPTPLHVAPFKGSPASMPNAPSSTSRRAPAAPAAAPPADANVADRVRKGLAALRKNRRRRRPYEVPGNGRIPPTPEPTLVRNPRKPPAGSGPARAEVPIPTAAPAEKPPVFLQATPVPRPSAPAPAPVRSPAALPSQARADRTTDTSVPRPTPAITNNPAPTLGDLPTTQPPGFATPGQSMQGSMARQNAATPSQLAAKKIWESIYPPQDSIGGKESRSGLQMQPGSAGLKPITNPAPPVSGLPRKTRSEQDRSRDGGNSII